MYILIKIALRECTDSTELLPLEHSTSAVWKFFGFPSEDGRIVETDKKEKKAGLL